MFADDRLIRLRALVAELERLPASPKTEWMLAEARARMVDVETGERPRALRPLTGNPPDGDPGRSATETADASPVKRPARQRAKPARDVPARPPSAVTASGKGEAPPRPAAAPATGDASA